MSKQVAWNKIVVEEFINLGGLNEFESRLIRDRMRGVSRIEMSIYYNCSLSTIDRTIKKLKLLYDLVQPYSDKLPKRIVK